MAAGSPPEIAFDEVLGTVRFELPDWAGGRARRSRFVRLLGGAILCVGLTLAIPAVTTVFMGVALAEVVVALAAFGGVWLVAGAALVVYGRRGVPVWNWVVLDERGITATWQAGPFRRSRRVAWSEVDRLAVVFAANVPGYEMIETGFLLMAERTRRGPVRLAGDDDRDRLLAVARELADRAKPWWPDPDVAAMRLALQVVEEQPRSTIVDRDEPPAGSTAILERHADGVTITVPRDRFRDLLRGPYGAGVVINLILQAFILAGIAFGSASAVAQRGIVGLFTFEGAILEWPGFVFLFVILAYVLCRRAELSARGGELTVRWTDLLGNHRQSWPPGTLADLRAVSELVDD